MAQKNKNLTEYQYLLFRRAIYGLGIYEQSALKNLTNSEKREIIRIVRRSRRVIETLKQERIYEYSERIINKFLHNNPVAKAALKLDVAVKHDDQKTEKSLTMKSLGISRDELILCLIKEKILPEDFFQNKSRKLVTKISPEDELPKLATKKGK